MNPPSPKSFWLLLPRCGDWKLHLIDSSCICWAFLLHMEFLKNVARVWIIFFCLFKKSILFFQGLLLVLGRSFLLIKVCFLLLFLLSFLVLVCFSFLDQVVYMLVFFFSCLKLVLWEIFPFVSSLQITLSYTIFPLCLHSGFKNLFASDENSWSTPLVKKS